jgi:hypothetical protein
MAKDTILVLGAGATLGGQFKLKTGGECCDPPLDNNFFQTKAVKSIFKDSEYPALFYYRRECGLETTWANMDVVAKLCFGKVISEECAWNRAQKMMNEKAKASPSYRIKMETEGIDSRVPSMAGWELLDLVYEVYKEIVPPKEESPLWQLVHRLIEKDLLKGVITFNYDTSLETLFRHHNQEFYYPCLPGQSGELPLMKLHGSLNWQYFDTPYEKSITVLGTSVKPEHFIKGYAQPEIVGPTFFKQEITIDFQSDCRARYYKTLWRFAWEQLKDAKKLVFVGFSFPQTDFHAVALFRTAHLCGLGVQQVSHCYKRDSKSCDEAEDRIEKIFKQDGRKPKFRHYSDGLELLAKQHLDELVKFLKCSFPTGDN